VTNEVYAPDGTPVDFFARLGAGESPDAISAYLRPGASVLDLGCGAGRLTKAFVSLGYQVVGVDESSDMLARVTFARTVLSRIEDLRMQEKFDAVLLPSFSVNTVDLGQRRAFLRTCANHVSPNGLVFVQRYDPATVAGTRDGVWLSRNGLRIRMEDVTIHGLTVRSTLVYETEDGSPIGRQPWGFLAIEEAELNAELERVALRRVDTLEETQWVVARPIRDGGDGV
jgi:SAM-dependent methyltransferase